MAEPLETIDLVDDDEAPVAAPARQAAMVIDLTNDDDAQLAHKVQSALREFVEIDDSDSSDEEEVVFVRQRASEDDDVVFVGRRAGPDVVCTGSTPGPSPAHARQQLDADEALARKIQRELDAEGPRAPAPAAPSPSPGKKRKRAPKGGDPFHGRDILSKERRGLFKFLASKATELKIGDVEMNPHSAPGGALYERFLAAWAWAPEKAKTRLVFHGTASANVANILEHGLDPRRRGASSGQRLGSGEYFGGTASVSTEYCGGGRKLIVFVIIVDRSARDAGTIVVSSDVRSSSRSRRSASRTRRRPARRSARSRSRTPRSGASSGAAASRGLNHTSPGTSP